MNLLNLFDIVDAVAAQKSEPTDNVVIPPAVQASQSNGQPATIVVPVATSDEVEVLEDDHKDSLDLGDEVIITGNVQYKGKTGRIVDFGRNKHFVVVDLYNFGKHSFHSSNVEHNDYADSEEEDADWRERDHGLFGDDEREEVDEVEQPSGSIFAATKDLEQLPRGMVRGTDFSSSIEQWKNEVKQKYPSLSNIEFADIRRYTPKDGSWSETALVKHPKTNEYVKLGVVQGNGIKKTINAEVYDTPQPLDTKWDRVRSGVSEASSGWEDEADQADRFHQMVVKKLSGIESAAERNNIARQLSKIEQKYFDANPKFNDVFRVMLTPIVNGVLTALKTGQDRNDRSQRADTARARDAAAWEREKETRQAYQDARRAGHPGVIAVGQRSQTGIAGRDKPVFDRTSEEAKEFLANARDEILDADEGYELVKVVDSLSRNQINNFRDVDWQEINTEFGPMVATADILVLVNKLGKNPSTDDVEVDNQEEVAEGAEFGAYYYEQLAQKVFDKYPDLSTKGSADELLDTGWKIAAQDLGVKRANWEFNYDEDFPSDFVSAYGELQRGEQGVTEAKGLNKRVRVVKTGETGTIRQVKHGAFKGAPKSYFVDLDNGKQADNLPASALRLIKDGVAEGGEWDEYTGGNPFPDSDELDTYSGEHDLDESSGIEYRGFDIRTLRDYITGEVVYWIYYRGRCTELGNLTLDGAKKDIDYMIAAGFFNDPDEAARKKQQGLAEGHLGNMLSWPEVVNKVNSAMKATGWKGQRKDDDSYMFSTAGRLDDEDYFVIISNVGKGYFEYALGTVEEGDPRIGEKEFLPMTLASVSELMDAIRDGFGLNEGEYDPSYDPDYRPYQKPEQDPDAWKQDRDLEEPSAPKTVTITDNAGKVVLTFPSTGGFYGDLRYATSKGFDTDSGDYHLSWKRDTNEGNNWLDTPVSEEFDRIKKLAGLK